MDSMKPHGEDDRQLTCGDGAHREGFEPQPPDPEAGAQRLAGADECCLRLSGRGVGPSQFV
jgi:hypothetical protein